MTMTTNAARAGTLKLPAGFAEIKDLKPRRRLVAVTMGPTGAGKSDWALRTSPEPVFYINSDPNGIEIAKKIMRETGRTIYLSKVDFSRDMSVEAAKSEWKRCEDAINGALRYNEGTLVLDTATEGDQLWRLDSFGKLEQVSPFKYGERNKFWKGAFNDFYASNMSVILIHKMKAVYVNDKRTDREELDGWNGMAYEADLVIHHRWNQKAKDDGGSGFEFTILKSNMRPHLRGLESDPDAYSFESILAATFDE